MTEQKWTFLHYGRAWWACEPILTKAAVAHALLGAALFLPMLLDDRTILGLNPWIKPQKFAFSIALFLGTMAWILSAHSMPRRMRTVIAWTLTLVGVLEVGIIGMQAWRGVLSHYNFSNRLDGGLYAAMGVAILIATLGVAVGACTPLRDSLRGPGLRWGVRCGEVVFLLGCAWGIFMSPRSGHSVGGVDGGPGLAYVNWSTTHGDLRVAHFVLLHGLQALPVLGFAVDRLLPRVQGRRWLVLAGACVMVAVAAGVARITLMGLPIVR
jgi:hypothetical protein